jgi:P27 family predicted phage terminase small subunit
MPPRKPIEAQSRHNTQEEIEKKKLEEESIWVGDEQLDNPPAWLSGKIAINEWYRLVTEFRKKQLVSNLDYNNLGAYCNAFSMYVEISEDLKEDDILPGTQVNPLVGLQLKYSEEMRKFANTLGLTVQSRLQSGGNALNAKDKELGNDFGDI